GHKTERSEGGPMSSAAARELQP
ncbi:DUF6009 family protein, partial [Streptomyces rubiginosohelvolus]